MQSVAGVSIRTSGPGMTAFEMRGISSTGGNSPTVGFYYDDVSLTAPSASNEGKAVISPALYDLSRVEVLRGPQGTLYGSGSMGGTIKVVPNAPNLTAFDASAEVIFGDTDHGGFDHAENAMVNLPFGGGTGPVPTLGPASCEAQLKTEYGSDGAFVNGPISFKSDNICSYEVGEKLRLLDNRVTVNGSLYFEKWSGVQQTNALSECGYVYSVNAGDAHVRGGELEIQAIVVPELTVSGNVGYTHAALVSSTLIDAGFSPGTAIQDVPQWTSTVSAAYRHRLTDELVLTARADNTYTGSRTDETYSINELPSYDLTNVRAGSGTLVGRCLRAQRGG